MRSAPVTVPRAYMPARAALAEIYRQTGTRYVFCGADADVRAEARVGPHNVGESRKLSDLLEDVAGATDSTVSWKGDVVLLQPVPLRDQSGRRRKSGRTSGGDDPRHLAAGLGRSGEVSAPGQLVKLAGSENPSVRRCALRALAGFEGDFMHGEWPGRLSVFELPGVELDTEVPVLNIRLLRDIVSPVIVTLTQVPIDV